MATNFETNARYALTIDKAKEQLKRIITVYLERDEDGKPIIPVNRQRPVMLMGAAGIGKTDVPRQSAEELGIGFVSYSMTHHTRQSALGLPKIVDKQFEGTSKIATEYTMSEIIAAVYEEMERTGNPNGILFLDEINCVPESLSAVMLQLFQSKTLGQCRIPEGWVLVMAGNPSEYNKSVKPFDAVTSDRLRIINVVPDGDTWIKYAEKKHLNSSVISYISSNTERIYSFNSAENKVVTPRGWEELSINLDAFEKHGYPVEGELIAEFIGENSVAAEFFDYYKMIKDNICEQDIDDIAEGKASKKLIDCVNKCRHNIRYMLITCLKQKLHNYSETKQYEAASAAMDNITDFLDKAYSGSSETEMFMNRILSDPEIVKMTILTGNKSFGKYLDEIESAEKEIKAGMKKIRKKEA